MDYISTFQRVEHKYLLSRQQADMFYQSIQSHVQKDRYPQYSLFNVYYDSCDNQMISKSIESPKYKEKLRVRSYGENCPFLYVEMKKKYEGIVYKRRIERKIDDAIHSNGNVTIEDGTISLQASDDGIHAEDTLTIHNGTIDISMSYEGLEAKNIVINDGVISIVSSDDGINSTDASYTGNDMQSDSSLLTINGGQITIDATGDGIDMNGDGEMNGGTLSIYGPENGGNGAIDYAGTFNVNGGTLLASGASNMAQMPSSSSAINAVMLSVSGEVSVLDSAGNTIASYSSTKSYGNLVIASEDLKTNETYTICVNGEATSTVTITDTLTRA